MNVGPIPARKFDIGDIYDVRYMHGDLPNRVWIIGCQMTPSNGKWKYRVMFESTHNTSWLDEDFLMPRIIRKDGPVYMIPVIQERYNAGWRFCGNGTLSVIQNKADVLSKSHDFIKHARICEAHGVNGRIIDGQVALWIKYADPIHASITDDGIFERDVK